MIQFRTKHLMKLWGVSRYVLKQMIADGILPEPIRENGRLAYWTQRQVNLAERQQFERENPPQTIPANEPTSRRRRGYTEKQLAQVREWKAKQQQKQMRVNF